ncbi:vWA domain-containing protein [Aureibaculum sp. 2210JD6-5]|uniref:vWA domain-containing protein n=1 Tax=Aureibaculum sp. 2210JD6-5 TaxID=3103957 RepID=UPI002AACB845|nr:vWA domain-containing protein [Aureibaculum sp. 2210JD6-5]MDY7396246.1 vWA domain-containing protein [Aureibaculum sp. 2210JD6-5]
MKNLSKILILLLICNSFIAFANENHPKKKNSIKVALLLDTSNSMDGLINQAKTQLWEIVNELSYAKCDGENPNLEIALYEYGNSNLPSREGFIRQVIGFSSDLDEISEKLFALKTNGGNEFCGEVIMTSLKELEWGNNKNDLNIIFIAGNEPFTQGKIDYKDAATQANEQDVVVNTIFCGNYQNGVSGMWKDGATLTGGEYMTINQDQKIVHIASPYDEVIIKLNKQLNDTYIYFGSSGRNKMQNQAKQDDNAQELSEVVVVKRAVSKSSRIYNNATWDLVDAEKEEGFSYDKLDKKTLPEVLKGKSSKEIKAYVAKQSKKRAEIQEKIQELNTKRNKYVAQKQKDSSNGLDNVMVEAIKRQAKGKNYSW